MSNRAQMRLPMRVWDLPVRLLHWLTVVLVAAAWVTQELADMRWHKLAGYALLTLLVFRLVWGFVGSETARFGSFLRNPVRALAHLRHLRTAEADLEVGHNAAGGWMVLLLLVLLAVQTITGLFASSDSLFVDGPLAHDVSAHASRVLTGLHSLLFYVLLAAIAVHVAFVVLYAVLKRQDLVRPMISGKKLLPAATRQPRLAPLPLAAAILVLAAALVWVLVTRL